MPWAWWLPSSRANEAFAQYSRRRIFTEGENGETGNAHTHRLQRRIYGPLISPAPAKVPVPDFRSFVLSKSTLVGTRCGQPPGARAWVEGGPMSQLSSKRRGERVKKREKASPDSRKLGCAHEGPRSQVCVGGGMRREGVTWGGGRRGERENTSRKLCT